MARIAILLIWIAAFSAVAGAATWETEFVDHSGPGMFSSLKLDKEGNAHVAYVIEDGDLHPLKYGFWDHKLKRWFLMTVAQNAAFTSLALDSNQRPHISWSDFGSASGAKLWYAHFDGSWKKQAIPLNSEVISYSTSIVLNSENRPAISFYEYRGPRDTEFKIRLRTVMWSGQSWELRTVDATQGSGKFNAMAIDGKGFIHLAYANVSADTLGMRYAVWDGKAWNPTIVEGLPENHGAGVGYSANVAVDEHGVPHMTYMNESEALVKYAVRREGKWETQVIDRIGGVGYPDRNAIALDAKGEPYIGYYDAGRRVLKIAHREGTRWFVEIPDDSGAGMNSSMDIHGGVLWITYADETNGGLKVARRSLSEPAESTGVSAKPHHD